MKDGHPVLASIRQRARDLVDVLQRALDLVEPLFGHLLVCLQQRDARHEAPLRVLDALDVVLDLLQALFFFFGLLRHFALPLLEAGIDLLVEKPIAATVEDARAISVAARRCGRVVAVGHVERFNPAWRAAVERAPGATVVEAVRAAPFTFRSLDVGVVHDLMIHDIDLVLSLEPGRLERVEAQGILATGGFEDVARARLVFSSGLVADLSASRISPQLRRTISMWSPQGVVHADLNAKTVEAVTPSDGVRQGTFVAADVPAAERAALKDRFFTDVLPLQSVTVADVNAIACEHDDFLAAIRTARPPLVTAAAGAAAVEIAARVIESLRCVRLGAAGPQRSATIPIQPRRKTG
ncbi:MAG: gfo/Idh/MocA family oxidoreductase [Planctomycetia bacterium]|nr:gfo/Idh/MocA family oxidoreductase [Planctomycetia bacterium]